jgi:hypothetical protein
MIIPSSRVEWAMDVGEWLRTLGLDQYEEKFRDNKIDVDVLAISTTATSKGSDFRSATANDC